MSVKWLFCAIFRWVHLIWALIVGLAHESLSSRDWTAISLQLQISITLILLGYKDDFKSHLEDRTKERARSQNNSKTSET